MADVRDGTTPPASLCECCAEAPATQWHPDQDSDLFGYCAPCVQELTAAWDALTPEEQEAELRG